MRDLVRWLVVLADEENVSAAADLLGIPQPTLSRRLARLESDLGEALFGRHGRRISLNDKGRAFVEQVRVADAALARAELGLHDADELRIVRLGFLHSFGTWLVPRLIRRARDADPGIGFELFQGASLDVTSRVRRGELDLGVVAPRPDDDQLAWRLLQRQRVQLAVPLDHPLAGERTIWAERLRDETFVSMAHGFGIRHVLDEVCSAAGFTPTIALECQELATVAGLVSAGIGVGLLPDDDQTNSTDGIRMIPLRDNDAHRDIGIVWRRGAVLADHIAAVRDLART